MAADAQTVTLKIKRGEGKGTSHWEEFRVPRLPQMNVISCLQEIQKEPRTLDGKDTTPVNWDCSCLEEVCGACTMVINGRARQSCSALVQQLSPAGETIVLEPMTKFPRVRDLVVDREKMFDNLKRVQAWIRIDGSHQIGPGPRVSPEDQEVMYALSRCMTCGCCLEACPNYNDRSAFMGPQIISIVRLYNMHPSGKMQAGQRLDALMGDGGVTDCGKAQNCVQVCPKGIPLTESIAVMGRETFKRALFGWLLKG
jgi:succinate dehydrogenase / fumarate reductase iron-sulfur subunit